MFRRLGPLTRSGAAELALSLPALRQLGEPQRELAWRLTGGHPRAMEYLDSLLATGLRFDDLAGRVTAAVQARIGWPPASTEPTELPEATAEVIAMTAGQHLLGELFDRLSAGAQDLLVRASVFRTPVTPGVLAARPADLAEGRAAGCYSPARPRAVRPPLDRGRTAPPPGRGGPDRAAGRRPPRGRRLLARPHRDAPARPARAAGGGPSPPAGRRPGRRCRHGHRRRAPRSAGHPPPRAASAPGLRGGRHRGRPRRPGGQQPVRLPPRLRRGVGQAGRAGRPQARPAAVRDQAAAWVASQVSASAILGVRPGHVLGPGPARSPGRGSAGAGTRGLPIRSARPWSWRPPRYGRCSESGLLRSTRRRRWPASAPARPGLTCGSSLPDGAAAYRTALAADLRARRAAGLAAAEPSARHHPRASRPGPSSPPGALDERLLITLSRTGRGRAGAYHRVRRQTGQAPAQARR